MPADPLHDRESSHETALASSSSSPQPSSSLQLSRSHSNAPAAPASSSHPRVHTSASPASSSSLADALGPEPFGTSSQPFASVAGTGKRRATSARSEESGTQKSSSPSEKARADVSADLPLTAHGKPRVRVYLACLQCRNRKVRCDGTKPECFNCTKRADPTLGQCSYDAAPRRRGKDRTPGSRKFAPYEEKKTRTTRSRLEEEAKRKKAEAAARVPTAQPARVVHDPSGSRSVQAPPANVPATAQSDPGPRSLPSTYSSAPRRITVIDAAAPLGWRPPAKVFETPLPDLLYAHSDALELARRIEEEEVLPEFDPHNFTSPSVQFTRETWWDALLYFYAPPPSGTTSSLPSYGAPLTPAVREAAAAHIAADLRFAFYASLHWFAFIHVPRFFGSLFDPYRRQSLQPCLVLALLALGTFFQSSELELGAKGRERALHLLDQAHATFQASLNSGRIDLGLVQTAWLLALFEMQAHPKCATPRTRSAFVMLDSLIRSLQLTTLDINDSRTTIFIPGEVPVVPQTASSPPAPFNPFSDSTLPLPAGICRSSISQPDLVFPRPEGNYPLNIPQPNSVLPLPGSGHRLNTPLPIPEGNGRLNIPQAGAILPHPEGDHQLHVPWQPNPLNIAQPVSAPAPGFDPQGSHGPHTYPHIGRYTQSLQTQLYDQGHTPWDCGCSAYSLVADWPLAGQLTPAWRNMPMWPRSVSEGELQKEECRRLVWCTLILSVAHNTKTAAGTDQEKHHLWIKDPANYALLFPGESFATADPSMPRIPASKNSVWALYMRTLFLWNSCLRARGNTRMSNADRAQFAMTAWLELDNVEAAMDSHTCDIQSGFMLQMREVLFNTRMVVSNEFRRYIPEALTEHGQALYHAKPNDGIMRALGLWHADRSLTVALEVAKAFAPCVEFMMMIWPSPGQRKEYEGLRNWLVRSCQLAGIPPPQRAIPPLKTGLAPPPAPTAAAAMPPSGSSTAHPGPSGPGWNPSTHAHLHLDYNISMPNTQPPLNPPHLHPGPDPFGAAADQVMGSYRPTQPHPFHPYPQQQPQPQPAFRPPFW
ncbi:hypothetical protein C8T65DRAFT_692713 [Cerioporus squamosus]|nr:hypothetical protein C8T65DRAFT_692713 [Cerioporus squamosus]